MKKSLIIAEKPSVAADIARAIGGFDKKENYFESEHYVLSSSIGHLLELCVPPEHDIKRGKWNLENLPLIPPHFSLNAIKKTKERLDLLLKLIKRKDVDELINACDAGREGELIFTYIVQHSGSNKPVKRLWLQSMTKEAIRKGFDTLKEGSSLFRLSEAARCRAESDWLVGINGTRALSAFNSRDGGFQLTPVGRVKTPTLSILVEREKKIRAHTPKAYWEIEAHFTSQQEKNTSFTGQWFQADFVKSEQHPDHTASRLWSAEAARQIVHTCLNKNGQVSVETKRTKHNAPSLFDLTTLQKEANKRFSFSAKSTLSIAQTLYEKLKLITYPRTDARYLPEDYQATVQQIIRDIAEEKAPLWEENASFARTILEQQWIGSAKKRVFNNEKISDHFAIIPTGAAPKELGESERKIYQLILKRFLAIFFPAAEYEVTTYITQVEKEFFKTEGKVLLIPGWKTLYQHTDYDDENLLPQLLDGSMVTLTEINDTQSETKAPSRLTEASLLSAMEHAGKLIEDSKQREAIAQKGLGTPATRATIIEDLLKEDYVIRQNKELIPTAKAFSLMTLLHGLSISELTSPEMTAEWEQNLSRIEQGELKRDQFMSDIRNITKKIVAQTKNYQSHTVPGNFSTLSVPCPVCGGVIHEQYQNFACHDCGFSLRKSLAGRIFEHQEMATLLSEGKIGPLQGFRSKLGRPFEATLYFRERQIVFDFSLENQEGIAIDETQTPLGNCPECGARVFDTERFYICEKAAHKEKSCSFKTAKTILKKNITPENMYKLLHNKKTDLIPDFVSKKGRKFAAYLVIKDDQKIGFEFQEREAKNSTPKKRKTASRSSTTGTTKTTRTTSSTATSAAKTTRAKSATTKTTRSASTTSKGTRSTAKTATKTTAKKKSTTPKAT